MNRRNFLRQISLTATAAVVAPLVITKVVTTGIIERETISSVERSVIQSSWLAKQDLEFHLNWERQRKEALSEMVVEWKSFRKVGKLKYYDNDGQETIL